MKTLFKILFIGTALVMLMSMFGSFALWNFHGPDMHISIGDDDLLLGSGDFGDFSDFGDWLGAGLGLLIAAVVCVVVLPLVLLLGVALPLLIVGGVAAVVVASLLGVGAVLGSPLILLGVLFFVIMRNRRRAAGMSKPTPV